MNKMYYPVVALALGHLVTDMQAGALPIVLPQLKELFSLSYSQLAAIVLLQNIMSSVIQPAFGYLTDRRSLPRFLPLCAALAGAGFAFVGWNALNGTTCPVFSSADKDTRTYKFEMPSEKVELEAVYEPTGSGELVLVNGVPDINNAIRRKVQDNVTTYFGRGWEYSVSD